MCVSEKNLYQAPILIADINSEQSLLAMCKQARVLLNCVGPVSNTSTVVILKIWLGAFKGCKAVAIFGVFYLISYLLQQSLHFVVL